MILFPQSSTGHCGPPKGVVLAVVVVRSIRNPLSTQRTYAFSRSPTSLASIVQRLAHRNPNVQLFALEVGLLMPFTSMHLKLNAN